MEEIWKTIIYGPNYEISNLGNIKNKNSLIQNKIKLFIEHQQLYSQIYNTEKRTIGNIYKIFVLSNIEVCLIFVFIIKYCQLVLATLLTHFNRQKKSGKTFCLAKKKYNVTFDANPICQFYCRTSLQYVYKHGEYHQQNLQHRGNHSPWGVPSRDHIQMQTCAEFPPNILGLG